MLAALFAASLGTTAALQVVTNATVNGNGVEGLEGGNLCMMGRLAPQFFLLGAPKSGTTFFYEDFVRSEQIVNYIPAEGEPNWHSKEPWKLTNPFASQNAKKVWLSHYPKCTQGKHLVAVDCTPGYFGSQRAPFAIQKAYSDSRHSLVFMVFLREPASRAHSHYYQYRLNGVLQGHFAGCSPQQFPPSFAHAVQKRMTASSMCNCSCDNIFEDSMYADSFRRYFKNFDSSSFHVVPFKKAVLGEVVDYAWRILKVGKGRGEKVHLVGGDNDKNHHDYPLMDTEMDAELLFRFKEFMDRVAGPKPLSNLLAGSDAHLYGHGGDREAPAIADWLTDNW